ncbi:LysR family transcriptional regulator [Erwinia sp. OLTSP20]|uniref:LysR family transcriptional regulator n=1 Tax=unclassified Erwinia TaxID=2622719 RepID=UPI000C19B992|nr:MULTISPECIES: LysR substrate-binding domain-containing protein [unclassified Erwinia]PIJ51692.1 LysR family transcriptional regulator [Erwinia sp. OAMSP11]PIJ75579.1 LysR family transcriptional regulator [Erwinia sp. OLSSP12]PIJ84884.1 LysR family transcriptional regulator [Erwinia sp. OLCASP19]PIJ86663.1 LysR family transcriptional regulator [Erwinia sp. OLMTSP26]PIJ88104.1 LysR family transcriptional regulator [Erwinia sp. OLMDSP33]
MHIELRHLRYFIAVAEELHFGRAAQRLNISQPPLSQQIQMLEKQINARLLARSNRRVELTAAGEQFLLDSRQILASVNRAAEKAARLHAGTHGELRIGFTSSSPFIIQVSDALSSFRYRYPDVHLQMQELNTRQQLEPLSDGRLDLGVMRNTELSDSLTWRLLMREPLCALFHRDHPRARAGKISVRELANEPFVFFDPHVGTALYSETLALMQRYQVSLSITQEVGEAMTIMGLVAAGLGVSILPASFRRVSPPEVVWTALNEADALSEVWLVWSRQREPAAALLHMIAMLTGDQ